MQNFEKKQINSESELSTGEEVRSLGPERNFV
jgi:hypothetical protein